MAKGIKSTSERINPKDEFRNPIFQQGVAIYRLLAGYVKDKVVLDIGCGEGFGTALLAEAAHDVVGVDRAQETVRHALASYSKGNLRFVVADALNLPFGNEEFNAISSVELIEHLADVPLYLHNVKRVLKRDGAFLLSTPNKELSMVKNPYHYREFNQVELRETLQPLFSSVLILGMHGSEKANQYFEARAKAAFRLKKWDILHIRELISHPAMSPLYDFIGKRFSKSVYARNSELAASITSEDFHFTAEGLASAMNFIAICQP